MGPKLVSKKRRRSHSAMYRLCQHTHQYSDCNGARRATPAKFRRQTAARRLSTHWPVKGWFVPKASRHIDWLAG